MITNPRARKKHRRRAASFEFLPDPLLLVVILIDEFDALAISTPYNY